MKIEDLHEGDPVRIESRSEPMEHGSFTYGDIVRVGDRLMMQPRHTGLPREELTPALLPHLMPANQCPWCGRRDLGKLTYDGPPLQGVRALTSDEAEAMGRAIAETVLGVANKAIRSFGRPCCPVCMQPCAKEARKCERPGCGGVFDAPTIGPPRDVE